MTKEGAWALANDSDIECKHSKKRKKTLLTKPTNNRAHASFHNLHRALLRFEEWSETKDRSNEMCRERPTSLAKLSSPSERVHTVLVLTLCVDRGERSPPLRRCGERWGTATKLTD